ncbi:MAG: glutathione S-transferase N-terminal domain-containing protein [Cyanobacteria bacterium P01_F01_bin.3]
MQLIGMLDSPYVRRVAIALHHFGIPFEHLSLSVFRNVDEFTQINPLVKAPTLVCDDGEVLMDSTLILNYIEWLADPGKSLMPQAIADYQRALQIIGLALNACDKSVQIVYERDLRPVDKQHQPWRDRIESQVLAAYDLLEPYAADTSDWLVNHQFTVADITLGVAWQFTQHVIADVVAADRYPAISTLSSRAEALSEFLATPLEPGWQPKR